MQAISKFSTRYPKTIILIVIGWTIFFTYQIKTNAYMDSDPAKYFPRDIESIKANDYYQKNYNFREVMIIGVEAAGQGIMTPSILRSIERMVTELKAMKTQKIIESKLTGKTETIRLPVGIDTDDITSISGLEDGMLDKETGAVITGSVIKKLKIAAGIPFTEADEVLLPDSDEDLLKIIPALKKRIINDRLFRGNILSTDGKATAIHVPMVSQWDYKRRFTDLELGTALDSELLKARFQGKTSFFPYEVYGKTIDGVVYDDAFVARHSKKVSRKLRGHLEEYLEPAYNQYPKLKELLAGDLTRDRFKEIMKFTQKRDFFMNPKLLTWDAFTGKLWDFTLEQIDPLSYENLEFHLPDVKKIYDLLYIYDCTREILERNSPVGTDTYVAGQPVLVVSLLSAMDRDMRLLLPIGLMVILFMLTISFRSIRGVVIPYITVVLSIIWAIGFMALTGTPITVTTSNIPIILLAVGSAYGIHFLNRYFEDARGQNDRRKILRKTIQGVGVAILMAGLTTAVGFLSLSSSSMLMIRHYAVFTSVGIIVALFLTFTLSPAILCYWRLPRQKSSAADQKEDLPPGNLGRILLALSRPVKKSPKIVLAFFAVMTIVLAFLAKDVQFEGAMAEDFKLDHPVRMSTDFINRYLTGTGEYSLLFKFRDHVNPKNQWIQEQLQNRSQVFSAAWNEMVLGKSNLEDSVLSKFVGEMLQLFKQPESNSREMEETIALMNDLLNEEYSVEIQKQSESTPGTTDSALDALLGEETFAKDDTGSGLDGLAGLAETVESAPENVQDVTFGTYSADQVNGLKDLNQRMGLPEKNWIQTGKSIVQLRGLKTTPDGEHMILQWNRLQDIFSVDVKQPYVLHKLEKIREQVFALKEPEVDLDGRSVGPTGFVFGPVDLVRKTYSLFYHDEDPAYRKIPDTGVDHLADPTMTDRAVIGVVLNQAQSSDRDTFNSIISPNLKEFQYHITVRSTLTKFNEVYAKKLKEILAQEFPDDNPYIESILLGGHNMTILELGLLIIKSQMTSIAQAMIFILIITFFIFRSVRGGVYSLIPLVFTILVNFAIMAFLGWKINTATSLVASISLGIGVDYTIHFLERFKAQLRQGDTFDQAYFNTVRSSGRAIIINAASVAAGFSVLLLADMSSSRSMGLLMVGTMVYSSLASLTLLPALIFVTKPKFLTKVFENTQLKPSKKIADEYPL